MNDILYAFLSIILVSAANAPLKWTMSRHRIDLKVKGFEKATLAISDPYFIIAGAIVISILWWVSIIINKVKANIVYLVIQDGAIRLAGVLCSVFAVENLLYARNFGILVVHKFWHFYPCLFWRLKIA